MAVIDSLQEKKALRETCENMWEYAGDYTKV